MVQRFEEASQIARPFCFLWRRRMALAEWVGWDLSAPFGRRRMTALLWRWLGVV